MATLIQEKVDLENKSVQLLLSPTVSSDRKIVAEGDSWFAYPLAKDIIDHLRKLGYAIRRHSRAGDTLENMVYGTDYRIKNNTAINEGPSSLDATLESIKIHKPRFVLFSAGGNDIVGKEFEQYLNHALAGQQLFKEEIFRMHVNGYMKTAIIKFLESVWAEDPNIDILMDGYDYAKPNGTRYEVLSIGFSGPWILPGFAKKGIVNRAEQQEPIIRKLVDGFNGMLSDLAQAYPKFHYIKLLGMFPNDNEWDNEIHLKSAGFAKVARLYHEKMVEILGYDAIV